MIKSEPDALFDYSEGCAGFFVFRSPKRITQTLEFSTENCEAFRTKTRLEAEQELMLAILENAMTCFQKYSGARDKLGMRLFHQAETWIFVEEKSNWVFSFDNICETLDLDSGYIREGLQRWRTIGLENGTGFDLESIRDGTLPKEG